MTDKTEFPKYIIIQSDVREVLKTLTARYDKAVEAYDKLSELADYEMPEALADVNVQSLEVMVQDKLNAVEASKMLTTEQANDIKKGWLRFKAVAGGYIEDLQTLLDNYPELRLKTDTGKLLCEDDLQTIAEAKCRKVVPPEAKTHYTLLCDVFARIGTLRKWEQEHDVKKVPFQMLLQMQPEDLAEAWVTGNVKIDHRYDNTPAVAQMKTTGQLFL